MNPIDLPASANTRSLNLQTGLSSNHAQTGLLLGQQVVVVSDDMNSLSDGAEELSLHMAEKAEDKHHSERKVKCDRPMELMELDEIFQSMEHSKETEAQAKLDSLVERLMEGKSSPRQAACDAFGDVTQQYLALQYAVRKGQQENVPAHWVEATRDALLDLELESGPAIRAGLNALSGAATFAPDAQGVQKFIGAYRDLVLGESSLGSTLKMALETFGGKDVARGLEQLIAALGQDLAATKPSTDSARLHALTHDLYQLQIAVTVLEGGNELAETLLNKNLARVDAERLMRDLVSITGESWISEARFTTMARQHGAESPDGRVAFLTGTKILLRELPVPVFTNADARRGHLDAMQEALDIAIDEEEQQ